MERSNSSSLSPLEFQNLLNVYRLCFEAAVKAHRAPSVTAFSQHTKYHDVWRVYEDKRTHGKIPLGAHKILVNAYNKWNLCDHFCAMIFDALRKHLEQYGAEVTWDIVSPSPYIVLIAGDDEPADVVKHSILTVQTKERETFFFDCTRKQFAWPSSEWLLEPRRFVLEYLDDKLCWEDGGSSLGFVRRSIIRQDDGYWGRIFETFARLWEELDWDMAMADSALAKGLVREKAEERAETAARETWGPN